MNSWLGEERDIDRSVEQQLFELHAEISCDACL